MITSYKIFTFISISFFFISAKPANTNRISEHFPIPPRTEKTLFYIQRSTNANTVVYEANILPNKTIDADRPVDIYWIRYAEKGQRKKLSYFERTFGYGVNCTPVNSHSYIIHFNASKSKELVMIVDNKGQAQANMKIANTVSSLEKIFIQVAEDGWWPKVAYIEFFGTDITSGKRTYEKMEI